MGFVLEGTGSFGNVAQPDGWKPGQSSRAVRAACCPQCGSMDVEHRGAREAGASLIYWQCRACAARFKTSERKTGRVSIVQ